MDLLRFTPVDYMKLVSMKRAGSSSVFREREIDRSIGMCFVSVYILNWQIYSFKLYISVKVSDVNLSIYSINFLGIPRAKHAVKNS